MKTIHLFLLSALAPLLNACTSAEQPAQETTEAVAATVPETTISCELISNWNIPKDIDDEEWRAMEAYQAYERVVD